MSVVRGRPPGLAGGIRSASRAYCSSLSACPAPKSPTKARFSAVHMACLQEGLLLSLNRRPGHYASSSLSTARAFQTASQPAIGERAGADTAARGTGAELDTARVGAAPYEEHERLRDWPTRGGRVQDHRNSRAGPLPRPYKTFQGKIEKSEIGQRITMDQADRGRDVP